MHISQSATFAQPDDLSGPSLPPLDEMLTLFAGADAWHFPGCESLGYPPLQVADCGHGVTLVAPPYGSATCFPTSVGMAATWNTDLIRQVGQALGRETRAKKCGMLLGPMINLHRLPCGGRNYETFSEDPVLTGKLAAAIIQGIQSEGTGACIKSFACNNQQREQKLTSAMVDPRTLREIYLKAFIIAIKDAAPWGVMTSYNPLNGEYTSDSRHWLKTVLRDELGYNGLVVSDWRGIEGDGALTSTIDMEMPGPGKTLVPHKFRTLLDEGVIDEEEIIQRARRVLELHERCTPARLGQAPYSPPELDSPRHRLLAREVAEESIVLLKNENNLLPLTKAKIKRLAVIGPNALSARLGGGGSASVSPFYSVSPLEGIEALAGNDIEVVYCEGCSLSNTTPVVPSTHLAPLADSFGKGLSGEYFDVAAFESRDGKPSHRRVDRCIDFSWGWAAPADGVPREYYAARWTGQISFPDSGEYTLTLSTQEGIGRVWMNDEQVLDTWSSWEPDNFEDNYTNRLDNHTRRYEAGEVLDIVVEYQKTGTRGGIRFGWNTPFQGDGIEMAEAIARSADAVVLVGGLSNVFEGGGCDRREFPLPEPQEELIQRVVLANPNTVVVLKNGTPVSMSSWISQVPAVLEAFYPGQEGGNAIARILFGEVNPSGKLPDTIPNSWEEVAAMKNYPGENYMAYYREGLMVGYRHYDASGVAPVFPFGYGLSYTTFAYGQPITKHAHISRNAPMTVSIKVTNTGHCEGKEIVQLYLEFIDPPKNRPPRQLIDFCKVKLLPAETQLVSFTISYDDLLTYNPESAQWEAEFPIYKAAIGPHSRELQTVSITAAQD